MKDQNLETQDPCYIYQNKLDSTIDTVSITPLCMECKQPALPNCYSLAGVAEFYISGLCEKCFDSLFSEDPIDDYPDQNEPAF